MSETQSLRTFSEQKHAKGNWKTHVSGTRNPIIRAIWALISLKRQYVNEFAKNIPKGSVGLEIGCGQGAYSHWLNGKTPSAIIAMDWSWSALQNIKRPSKGAIHAVCADAKHLPFKEDSFGFFFSIDTLGHIVDSDSALNEMLRVAAPGTPFFIHSECLDYQNRWPDKWLIRKLGKDILAEYDGHVGLQSSEDIFRALSRRFIVDKRYCPAGHLGWLMGYPEKYFIAFKAARWYLAMLIVLPFLICKKLPLVGACLRLANIATNRMELFFGLAGGGSCFAFGTTPAGGVIPPSSK